MDDHAVLNALEDAVQNSDELMDEQSSMQNEDELIEEEDAQNADQFPALLRDYQQSVIISSSHLPSILQLHHAVQSSGGNALPSIIELQHIVSGDEVAHVIGSYQQVIHAGDEIILDDLQQVVQQSDQLESDLNDHLQHVSEANMQHLSDVMHQIQPSMQTSDLPQIFGDMQQNMGANNELIITEIIKTDGEQHGQGDGSDGLVEGQQMDGSDHHAVTCVKVEDVDDLKGQLDDVSERIKLLRKQLEDVTKQKLKVLKQVEELVYREQELKNQLMIATNTEKFLSERMSHGLPLTEADQASLVSLTAIDVTDSVTAVVNSEMTSSQEGDGTGDDESSALARVPIAQLLLYLQPIQPLSVIDQNNMAVGSKPPVKGRRGRKKKVDIEAQTVDNDFIDTVAPDPLEFPSPPEEEEKSVRRKKRKRSKVSMRVPLHCSTCDKKFKLNYHLQRHLMIGCGVTKCFPCHICSKEFTMACKLKLHMRTHVREEHRCQHCGRGLATRYQLLLHIRQHEGDLRQLCSTCGKSFVDWHALRQHMVGHTRPHPCDFCGRRFSRIKDMKIHRRLHTGECYYTCQVCNKSYATATMLRRHSLTHNEVKEQICGLCARAFHHISELRIHMRTHTGEEAYRCVECNMGFTGRYQWNKHQWDKHGAPKKTRTCELCGKVCTTPSNLRNHQRSHSVEKPHKCVMCEKQYKNMHDLMVHLKKKHDIVPAVTMTM